MPKHIVFEGKDHFFPDDFTDADISKSLAQEKPAAQGPMAAAQAGGQPEAPKQPWFSKAAETANTPIAKMLGFDTSRIDQPSGGHPGAEFQRDEGFKDPLTGNPLKAELAGFTRGAVDAVTPAWVASALSLGKGGLVPKVANAVLTGQGAGEAFDPTKSTSERLSGAVQGLAGLLGLKAASAVGRAAKAPEAIPPSELNAMVGAVANHPPQPKAPSNQELNEMLGVYARPEGVTPEAWKQQAVELGAKKAMTADPTKAKPGDIAAVNRLVGQKAGAEKGWEQEARNLNARDKWIAGQQTQDVRNLAAKDKYLSNVDSATAATLTDDMARKQVLDTIQGEGLEPQAPRVTETVSAPQGEGLPAQRVTQTYAKPQPKDEVGEIMAAEPATPKTPPPAPGAANPLANAPQEPLGAPPAQSDEGPAAALAKLFKTRQGASGANYSAAKAAAKAGEIPSADTARASHLLNIPGREAEGSSLLQESLAPKSSVVPGEGDIVPGPGGSTAPYIPSNTPTTPAPPAKDWVGDQLNVIERLKKLGSGEAGQLSPAMIRSMAGLGGGVVGAPIGAANDPDNPIRGGMLGAATGGILGAGIAPTSPEENLLKNLLTYRKLSFLSSPMVSAKKALGDSGGMLRESARLGIGQALGEEPQGLQMALNGLREFPALHPVQTAKDFWQGLGDPSTQGTTMYDIAQSAQQGPLGWVGKPISGITNVFTKSMERAGWPEPTVQAITGVRAPETELGKDLQVFLKRHPNLRDYALPFTKMATNIAEGARNIPGVASFAGNPDNAKSRAILGGLQMAAGGASSLYDEAQDQNGSPTPFWLKALRPAAMGVEGVMPFLAGEAGTAALTHGPAQSLMDLWRAIPGSQGYLPNPLPNEKADEYINRMLGQNIKTMQPAILTKEWWDEPQAR